MFGIDQDPETILPPIRIRKPESECEVGPPLLPAHYISDCAKLSELKAGSQRILCRVCGLEYGRTHRCTFPYSVEGVEPITAAPSLWWRTTDGKFVEIKYEETN